MSMHFIFLKALTISFKKPLPIYWPEACFKLVHCSYKCKICIFTQIRMIFNEFTNLLNFTKDINYLCFWNFLSTASDIMLDSIFVYKSKNVQKKTFLSIIDLIKYNYLCYPFCKISGVISDQCLGEISPKIIWCQNVRWISKENPKLA